MKLHVWTSFCPDYSSGLAFAIAKNLEDAQKMVVTKYGNVYEWGDLKIYKLTEKVCEAVGGGA